MSNNNKRLLLELHKSITDINRSIINPRAEELKLDDLTPMIEMVATARANYLEEMLNISRGLEGNAPSTDQLKRLRHYRLTFEELAHASHAIETAIERGYLDVESD